MACLAPQLPLSSSAVLALSALRRQGEHGAITELAESHAVSRRTVYSLRERGRMALEGEFAVPDSIPGDGITLTVTEADMARTVIALRAITPSSIRNEVAMLPIIYGTGWSFGKIQALLVQAGERAACHHAGVDLSDIQHVAQDEMFSQGKAVLAGIDLDTQYLYLLEAHDTRKGEDWVAALSGLRDLQGLRPCTVVKDSGSGLAKGVSDCWPGVRENDDLFHAVYMMGREAYHLERRAYSVIAGVDELVRKRAKAKTVHARRSLGQKLRQKREYERVTIERYDRFEELRGEAQRVLELTDRGSGQLRRPSEVVEVLTRVAEQMMGLGTGRVKKVARYLGNRAKGLGRYLDDLGQRLDAIVEPAGGQAAVEAVTRAYQASLSRSQGGPRWDRKARAQELREATRQLVEITNREPEDLYRAVSMVLPILFHRYRASSAIENLNSVLRPYLVAQKSTSKPFLDLFRFYWNTRTREWGPHKGTSAHELLTGERVDDWLTLLGYPPGEAMAQAA